MTQTTIRVQMAQREDTAANWTSANPILLSGEIGYENDTTKLKIGDGTTNWNSLAYHRFEPVTSWTLTANGTTDYIFSGTGFAGTETDPDLYVVRGQTYKFINAMGAHPFQIQSTQGASGTAYNDGITNNAVSDGTLTWEVRMDAPSTLYYQCTSHADMNGTIYVLDEGGAGGATAIDDLSDVDTSTVAPTDGQALVWDNTAQKWEPGSGGTTLPSAVDGEALIYENGQWVAGPVIGGVSYTSNADPEYSNVQLLLHFNGANGSTTFTDSSSNGLTVTANNNTQISTTQSKFGGASGYFDGTDDTLSVSSSLLSPYTSPFTLELWYYSIGAEGGLVNTGNASGGYDLFVRNGELKFNTYAGGTVLVTTAPSLNSWHHVAVTRDSSNNLRMFVDGALADSTTNTENLNRSSFTIGTNRTNYYDLQGYIDDLRLTTGVARYTAAFTPPTTQLAGAGTPVTVPASDSIRTLLGIDEYADDTAAGTGGLSSGELYYNTTSSSYVLKS